MNKLKPENYIEAEIVAALKRAFDCETDVVIERPKQEAFGDFATTVALGLAKVLKSPPRQIAETLVKNIADEHKLLEKTTIDGPGFINFTLSNTYWHTALQEIIKRGDAFGSDEWGQGEKRQIEFVSANPTGPLNVVSARAAAVGDVLVSLLEKVGYNAEREYYINDAGRQVRLLGASVSARYMALFNAQEAMPEDGYQGEYVIVLAREIADDLGDKFVELDRDDRIGQLTEIALAKMLAKQKKAMEDYRVNYQVWFHESNLRRQNLHFHALERLQEKGLIYKKDGATWFKSSEFGDEKDRVLLTSDGEPTYFMVDIAYHQDKFERGFTWLLDLWGPDHHGYIPRMSAAMQALGHPKGSFQVKIIQQVNMLRAGETIKMSKRAGNIIEMAEVVDEVGVDAARFFFIMRRLDSHMDFDIELAKKQTDENPVYYVQYAHARLFNILEFAKSQGVVLNHDADISILTEKEELTLIKKLAEYPEVISKAAELLEPHRLTTYLMELAGSFHSFYQKHRVVSDDKELSQARLVLVDGTRIVVKNALDLLKIT
ncbi:MAG: arginine--tRNA ligase, partial [bacterium]